jgi:peptide/nickel transport system substrate-binding protein
MDAAQRDAMIRSALIKLREGVYVVPLHRQMLSWAMRDNIDVVHTPWSALILWWIRIK